MSTIHPTLKRSTPFQEWPASQILLALNAVGSTRLNVIWFSTKRNALAQLFASNVIENLPNEKIWGAIPKNALGKSNTPVPNVTYLSIGFKQCVNIPSGYTKKRRPNSGWHNSKRLQPGLATISFFLFTHCKKIIDCLEVKWKILIGEILFSFFPPSNSLVSILILNGPSTRLVRCIPNYRDRRIEGHCQVWRTRRKGPMTPSGTIDANQVVCL